MEYFFKINNWYTAKNKLQAEFVDKIKDLDNTLVTDLEGFKAKLLSITGNLNNAHHRCRPLKPEIHPREKFTQDPYSGFKVDGLLYSSFYPVNHEFPGKSK